jgi:hypothetical protein
MPGGFGTQHSYSHSTQRTRVLSPGEIANIPAGHALHLDGVRWELVTLTPIHPQPAHPSRRVFMPADRWDAWGRFGTSTVGAYSVLLSQPAESTGLGGAWC